MTKRDAKLPNLSRTGAFLEQTASGLSPGKPCLKIKWRSTDYASCFLKQQIVHGRAKLIAHGFDHMRAEHLQKLWGFKDDDPQQALFRRYYTKWINMLMCKEIPDEFRP